MALACALSGASVGASAAADAVAPNTPRSITAMTAQPGPRVGEITFKWTQDGQYTTSYVLETALSSFSKTNPDMPYYGRASKKLTISRSVRSYTMSAAQAAAHSAPVASGNHLYFRLTAVNRSSSGATAQRSWPYLQAVLPRPQAPSTTAGKLRIASFNVRTARAGDDARTWLQRAPEVAGEIVRYNPGVVALQELGPGRADGQKIPLGGAARQTTSLLTALDRVGGSKYDLVRTTPYVAPGLLTSTQGARILYDNTRYVLRSRCPETTDGRSYSGSCSIHLPILSTDTESARAKAAVALFEDRATGKRFWFVSAHLDARHSDTASRERTYDGLRKAQANAITAKVNAWNTATPKAAIVIGGDFNSYQNSKVNNSSHDTLISQGYYDTSAAVVRRNFKYSTMNHFDLTIKPASQGVGVRLDMLFVKGARGASQFANVMAVTDSTRPSDHNLIFADIAPFAR